MDNTGINALREPWNKGKIVGKPTAYSSAAHTTSTAISGTALTSALNAWVRPTPAECRPWPAGESGTAVS